MKKKIYSNVGLIEDVVVKEVITLPSTIKRLAVKRDVTITEIREVLRYNILSAKQLAFVTGTTVATVMAMAKPKYYHGSKKVETKLDYCFPFPIPEEVSFKFIFRNKRCEDFIMQSLDN